LKATLASIALFARVCAYIDIAVAMRFGPARLEDEVGLRKVWKDANGTTCLIGCMQHEMLEMWPEEEDEESKSNIKWKSCDSCCPCENMKLRTAD
jgi:hypothetical protein